MSKKNKGHNAFYFFMLDWRQRQADSDRKALGSLKDVAADSRCNKEWQNLAPDQRQYYEAKAKGSKANAQGSMGKMTSLGESMNEIEELERKQHEFQLNMFQYIDSVVAMGIQHNNLTKQNFIFIHVNWFYQRQIGINKYEFCPAEFAVAEFSLEKGMQNIYHEILNVKIALGWRRDAIETSQQTHQIPIELEEGESDFKLMNAKFISLLESNKTGQGYPPLFTVKDLVPVVESFLIKLTDAGNATIDDFQIYSIEALFGALRNAAAQNVDSCSIPLVVAENEFAKDMFSSTSGLECEFHKIIDGSAHYCSKSIVKRWGFTICDYCCEFLGIDMIEGTHCPCLQLSFADQDIEDRNSIDSRIKCLNIGEQKVLDMNGVSSHYRTKVSERSYRDEQKRRNECAALEIIEHSKLNSSKSSSSNLPPRPLRLPKTQPQALFGLDENVNSFNLADFPPIGGRGTRPKKWETNNAPGRNKK